MFFQSRKSQKTITSFEDSIIWTCIFTLIYILVFALILNSIFRVLKFNYIIYLCTYILFWFDYDLKLGVNG